MSWQAGAACRTEPDSFFGDNADTAAAQAVCARCSVFDECFDWVMLSGEPMVGVVAGMTEEGRGAATCKGCLLPFVRRDRERLCKLCGGTREDKGGKVEEKHCAQCGDVFQTTGHAAKFCSNKCRRLSDSERSSMRWRREVAERKAANG